MAREPLYTVEDVARLMSVHPETVRNWIKSGQLKAIRLGGAAGYRIAPDALDQFLRERQDNAQTDSIGQN